MPRHNSVTSAGGFGQRDVGHSVIATGRGGLRLSSSISVDVWTPAKSS
ncbi:hypothetical protein ACQKMI_18175 [Lysinibacillus sp. NPDC097214]